MCAANWRCPVSAVQRSQVTKPRTRSGPGLAADKLAPGPVVSQKLAVPPPAADRPKRDYPIGNTQQGSAPVKSMQIPKVTAVVKINRGETADFQARTEAPIAQIA